MQKKRIDTTLIALIVIIILGYILMHDLFGGTLFSHNAWDSYTLQALSWREGRLDLGQNYSWLEIAVFEGKYFVSFPPVPTLIMLPLTFIFGENTPNNLVVMTYAILIAVVIYKTLLISNMKRTNAALLAALAVFGSNALWMSTIGGVWFQAQLLNMLLLVLAMYCGIKGKRAIAYICVAFAVGCRPFSLWAFPVLAVAFLMQDYKAVPEKSCKNLLKTLLKQCKYLIVPAIIGCCYMAFNYARFGNVFEFGHNYLPEFETDAQFGAFYILGNLKNLLATFVTLSPSWQLEFPLFNGFFMFIANPIFIITFVAFIKDIIHKRIDTTIIAAHVATLAILICTCAHKTLGGWQFGARYTVDMIPIALFAFIYSRLVMNKKQKELRVLKLKDAFADSKRAIFIRPWKLNSWEIVVCVFGIMFNVYGAIVLNLNLK